MIVAIKEEKFKYCLIVVGEVLNKISDSLLGNANCWWFAMEGASDEELAKEARAIMNGWGDSLTVEQQELLNEFIPNICP